MLKTECPKCKCAITSPFLAGAEDMECPNCKETFHVKDVCISAGPYSIYREVLLKNIHKYVRLLREARIELKDLEEQGKDSLPFKESAKTVNIFMERLKELLDGCRDKLRVPGGGAPVDYTIDDASFEGSLQNISVTGLCLKVESDEGKAARGRSINLSIKDPALDEPLSLNGQVVWDSNDGLLGVKFDDVDDAAKEALSAYMATKTAMPGLTE